MNFEGKRALVTGGSKGIGLEIVKKLEQGGAEVVYTSRTSNNQFGEHWEIDFQEMADVHYFFHRLDNSPKFDIIVNNMGINKYQEMNNLTAWWNYEGIMYINCEIPLRIMLHECIKEDAKIVNISSISGQYGLKGRSAYCSSKHALNGITKTMAVEKPTMCVNTVSPGPIETEMTDTMLSEQNKEEILKRIPKGRFGSSEEVANLVLFLVSDLNTYITGQDFVIDGGLTATWWNH